MKKAIKQYKYKEKLYLYPNGLTPSELHIMEKKLKFSDPQGEYTIDEDGFVEMKATDGEGHKTHFIALWRAFRLYYKENKDKFIPVP